MCSLSEDAKTFHNSYAAQQNQELLADIAAVEVARDRVTDRDDHVLRGGGGTLRPRTGLKRRVDRKSCVISVGIIHCFFLDDISGTGLSPWLCMKSKLFGPAL